MYTNGKKPSLTAAMRNGAPEADAAPAAASITVPVADVTPWPGNPRKTFDPADLKDLADSLKALGVLQPILVRRRKLVDRAVPNGRAMGPAYEIADGERRYRAAKLAGLVELPVIVRALDDRQMLEIAIVSCEQRADVSPLEKADGYARLLAEPGVTLDTLAGQIGKSASTIRGLLKLQQLPDVARQALAAGEIPSSTAQLIARVPGDRQRLALAHHVLWADDHWAGEAILQSGLPKGGKRMGGRADPLSFRETKDLIERALMRELKQAPFSRKSIDLLPAAGSCEACPKRTGNDPETFPGARADVCTDTACYAAKVKAHGNLAIAKARAEGRQVLDGPAGAKLFSEHNAGQLRYDAPWVDLAQDFYDGKKHVTYQERYGKLLAAEVVVAVDREGNAHKLLPKGRVEAEERKARQASGGGQASGGNDAWKKQQKAAEAKAKLHKKAAAVAVAGVARKMRDKLGFLLTVAPEATDLLRAVLLAQIEGGNHDVVRVVERGRGLKAEGKHKGPQSETPLVDFVRGLTGAHELLYVWAELVAARESIQWSASYGQGPQAAPLWDAFGIKPAAILAGVKASAKEAKPAKAKGKSATAADPDEDEDDEDDEEPEPEHDLGDPVAGAGPISRAFEGVFVGDLRDDWADVEKARADLERASIVELHSGSKPLTKPAKVRPVRLTYGEDVDALWVSTAAVHQFGHTSWLFYPLMPRAEFERLHPHRALRVEPPLEYANDEERRQAYYGVRVLVGKAAEEYVIEPPGRGMYVTTKQPAADADADPVVKGRLNKIAADLRGTPAAPQPSPAPAAAGDGSPITANTMLADLDGDSSVGFGETCDELDAAGVRTVGALLDRARAQARGAALDTALYAALRSVPKVSADMARRFSHALLDLLRPLWGDPEAKARDLAARSKDRRCRECGRDEGHVGVWVWAEDNLCSDCFAGAKEPAHAH